MIATATDRDTETFNLDRRVDFPILDQQVHGQPLCYLDSAASAQSPAQVIEAVASYHRETHANVHRGVHTLSQRATDAYESARRRVADFVGADSEREVIFTSGTTEAINLVAAAFVEPRIRSGDEILVTYLEHHANIVPWQLLCERTGATLVVVPIEDDGSIAIDAFASRLNERTRIAAFAHVSNALGTVLPVEAMTRIAHDHDVPVLIDGAQGVPHGQVDVGAIGCDFYAFSGHKMYGPTGIGCLIGREDRLLEMRPWQGGGDMIREVSFNATTYNDIPFRFEAGTPNIAGAVGLAAAIEYLDGIGLDAIANHESELLTYATDALNSVPNLRIVGQAPHKVSVLSFVIDGLHPTDIGTLLDHQGIAIRTGHHCAMPVMQFFGLPGTARASLGLYNHPDDIDRLVAGLAVCRQMLAN